MLNWFARNIGEDCISSENTELLCYSSDASQIDGKTSLVVRPKDIKQLHQIILFMKRNKSPLTLRGGGTGLRGGAVPDNSTIIDLVHLNKILELKEDSVRVEPGMTLYSLNEELKKKGKMFPITPLSHKSCTIGGMIATNASTIGASAYGKTGNWIIDVDIIDGEGRYKRAELREIVGKEGTTGVIVSARLKIIDIPKMELEMREFDYVNELVFKLKELIDANSVLFVNQKAAQISGIGSSNYLLIENRGKQEDMISARIIKDSDSYDELEEAMPRPKEKAEKNKLLEMNRSIYDSLVKEGYIFMEDVKISSENMERFLVFLEKNDIPALGPVMSGVVYPFLKDRSSSKKLYEVVKNFGGSVLGSYGAGIEKKDYVSIETKQKTKQLRQNYDPENIINRGLII